MSDRELVEEGGDPACWAHLFDDDGDRGDDGTPGDRPEGDGEAEQLRAPDDRP